MNIPDKAIEAFQDAIEQTPGWLSAETIREALEAAAPLIAAQALRDEADIIDPMHYAPDVAPYISMVKANLKASADEMDPQ